MTTAVTLVDVTKEYRLGDGSMLRAADRVTLDLPAGEMIALVGASGSGKSTLLHLIGAIDAPDSGTITVGGQVITGRSRAELADYRAGIGFVFQQFHLIPALTLLDNVSAPLIGRAPASERRTRALDMLDAVGLAQRATAVPSQLSGGQQQRVAIARALVVNPAILLADEPTGNLDSSTAAEILDLIGDLHERFGTTAIIATHDEGVAGRCSTVVTVEDGRASLRMHPRTEAERTPPVESAPRRAIVD